MKSRLPTTWWILFSVGILLSLVMVARSQVAGDQLNMLARGWLLAERGTWVVIGLPTSAGGKAPGGLTSLLVGLPFFVWLDHRAATLGVLLFHIVGYLLLDRVLGRSLSPRGRLLFCVFFWLNPWRVHFSGFLWNSNYLVLFSALHLWTAYEQRHRPSFWMSALHVIALGAAMQLHGSFPILVIASALLFLRRHVRPHWGGVALGTLVVALSLVPWLLAVAAQPELAPRGKGFLGRGFIYLFPVLKGVVYWLRYPSLWFSQTGNAAMITFDFRSSLGAAADSILVPPVWILTRLIGPLTVLFPLRANLWIVRRNLAQRRRAPRSPVTDRTWLRSYVLCVLGGAVISFGLSPTTAMSWQGFIALHAAVLGFVLWLEAMLRTRRAAVVRLGVRAYLVAVVVLCLAMAFGAPHYRPGGRGALGFTLKGDHPMVHDLGLDRVGSVRIDPDEGSWPDVLMPSGSPWLSENSGLEDQARP